MEQSSSAHTSTMGSTDSTRSARLQAQTLFCGYSLVALLLFGTCLGRMPTSPLQAIQAVPNKENVQVHPYLKELIFIYMSANFFQGHRL